MTTRIRTASRRAGSVKVTSPRGRKVSVEQVATALGASPVSGRVRAQSPGALLAVRQEILSRLSSSGGRPALAGTTRRQKIPLDDEDWDHLRQIAEALRDDDVRPTAGQVASVLLHKALDGLDIAEAAEWLRGGADEGNAEPVSG